ncbi:MAG TPA: response regulator [Acidobacteriaceae bacterium]|nr:response regulator [Acidobacteriaceae bacterium]
MVRPCFLVIDREFPGSISTRKLVIETAKFNVITAYSGAEALETLARFPKMNGVVLDADMQDISCERLVQELKAIAPSIRIVVISAPGTNWCEGADHHLESLNPRLLLSTLQKLVPEQAAQVEAHEESLAKDPKA